MFKINFIICSAVLWGMHFTLSIFQLFAFSMIVRFAAFLIQSLSLESTNNQISDISRKYDYWYIFLKGYLVIIRSCKPIHFYECWDTIQWVLAESCVSLSSHWLNFKVLWHFSFLLYINMCSCVLFMSLRKFIA